jgi:D-lyxose ketol-isomerase
MVRRSRGQPAHRHLETSDNINHEQGSSCYVLYQEEKEVKEKNGV